MKRGVFVLFCVFVMYFSFLCSANNSTTQLIVGNSAPYLYREIPLVSFDSGEYNDVFDLDDYFLDFENDTLSYNVTTETGLNVSIDSEGIVSFYAANGTNRTFSIYFTAMDSELSEDSNFVTVYVGADFLEPTYSNETIDKNIVYQNSFVNFSIIWYDDRGMDHSDFYFYQEGFSTTNESNETNQTNETNWDITTNNISGRIFFDSLVKQITVPVGGSVQWKFCGYDGYNNSNCTDVKTFYVYEKPPTPSQPQSPETTETTDSAATTQSTSTTQNLYQSVKSSLLKSEDNFSVSVNSFSIGLKQGFSQTKVFEIKNEGSNLLNFSLRVRGVEDLVFLSDSNFTIDAGKTKKVTLDFSAGLSYSPGEYYGEIIIEGVREVRIPLAIFVNPSNISYDVLVDVLEERVKPGKNVTAQISIENLLDATLHDIEVTYALKDFNGNIYASSQETLQLEKILEFEKSIPVPDDFMVGDYIFYVRVESDRDYAIGSDSFLVGTSYRFDYYLKYSFSFIVVFILCFVFLFLILRYKAKKKKEKVLNLYVKFQELKEYLKKKDYSKAANLFISIKKMYGEKVSKDVVKDREVLLSKIKELSEKIDFSEEGPSEGSSEKKESKEKEGEKKEGDSSKEGEEKKEGESKDEEKKESDAKPVEGETKKEEKVEAKTEEKKEEKPEAKKEEKPTEESETKKEEVKKDG